MLKCSGRTGFLKVLHYKKEKFMSANNISASCPISLRRVDANMVRAISFQVALFAVILLFTQESFFALVLLFDFTVRTLRLSKFSPFHLIAKFILTGWGIAPKLCDESPKRFALYMGLGISLVLAVLFAAGLTTVATFISIILLVCALLETLFDFCIGCKIYYGLQLLRGVWRNDRDFK
jgi:hypothetical protein